MQAAEQEEWERVSTLMPTVTSTLEAFRATPIRPERGAIDTGLLQEILQMLQKATALCTTRKEQIAPLVKVLKEMPTSADEP